VYGLASGLAITPAGLFLYFVILLMGCEPGQSMLAHTYDAFALLYCLPAELHYSVALCTCAT
jgi:hypothetical protein